MKIPNIYNFLNSICPNAFNSKSIKIQKYPGQNCPDASNPKYIENSQNKLCQLFKNTFLCQNVSILSNQKPTYIINTKLIS